MIGAFRGSLGSKRTPMRFLFPLLLLVALVFGASHASAIIYWAMGPWSAVGFEQDGSQTHMQFGQNLPRPEWVPLYPGASVVTGSRLTSVRQPSGFHSLEISTRASLDEVKRFYAERLTARRLRGRGPRLDVAQSRDRLAARDRRLALARNAPRPTT